MTVYGTDKGAPCIACGGTVWEYTVTGTCFDDGIPSTQVDARCVSCGLHDEPFEVREWNSTVSQLREKQVWRHDYQVGTGYRKPYQGAPVDHGTYPADPERDDCNPVVACEYCGCLELEYQAWVRVRDDTIVSPTYSDGYYCPSCSKPDRSAITAYQTKED